MLVRVAELLGVAGIDVPIKEMKKWIPPYKVKFTEIQDFNLNIKRYLVMNMDYVWTSKAIRA